MKKMLIVGELGYHEKNIIQPIISKLKNSFIIERIGKNFDFFIPANYDTIIKNYCEAIPISLKEYDVVFFVDYWNMILPLFMYKKAIENPKCKFLSLFHGSIKFENDVAWIIPNCEKYEEYLLSSYDSIFVHSDWIKQLMGGFSNLKIGLFPFDVQFNRQRPILEYSNIVYFIHRFNSDKGNDIFLKFVDYCKNDKIEFKVFDENPGISIANLEFLGRKTLEEVKEFVSSGGYSWSSVKSETVAYGTFDLLSFGLTPILNNHPAHSVFNKKFIYNTFEEAKNIILNKIQLTNSDWNDIKEYFSTQPSIADYIIRNYLND